MFRKVCLLVVFVLQAAIFNFALADGNTTPKYGQFWRYGNGGEWRSAPFATPEQACNAYAKSLPSSHFNPPNCYVTSSNVVSLCSTSDQSGNIVVTQHASYSSGCTPGESVGEYQQLLYGETGYSCPGGAFPLEDGTCQCPVGSTLGGKPLACLPIVETVSSRAPVSRICQRCFADPIYPLTGTINHPINFGVGVGLLNQSVTYDTARRLPVYPMPAPRQEFTDLEPIGSQPFGELWSGSLQKQLLIGESSAQAIRGDGTMVSFSMDINGNYIAAAGGESDRLISTCCGFLYIDSRDNTEETYGFGGLLTAINTADGQALTHSYSDASTPSSVAPSPGLLIQVQDNFGHATHLSYSGKLVSQVTDTAGVGVNLKYDAAGNLNTITWADGTFLTLNYDRSDLPWALTSVVDENGVPSLSYEFDAGGRVTAAQLGGGAERHTVDYGASPPALAMRDLGDPVDPTRPIMYRTRGIQLGNAPVVTYPNGSQATVSGTIIQNVPYFTGLSQPPGAGTGASTKGQTFDPANGNRLSSQDFNGNTTCYAYESARSLVTVTLEGLPSTKTCPSNLSTYAPSPADAAHPERKTTSVWHPDWRLKIREAEPKKITTWVYNGQPDPIAGSTAACVTPAATLPDGKPLAVVCARYEQATTDATGAQGIAATVTGATRAWTYTYNSHGQMLTQTTPKQSATDALSHTTTYAYYADTSIASNVGHTAGDLQSVTNPLNQTTTFTSYDVVGRQLSSKDANGTVTTRTYWPRGWLKSQTVTPAGGSAAAQTTFYVYWPTGLLKTVTMPDASTLSYGYDDAHRLTDVTDSSGNNIHYVLDNVGNRTGEQVSDASGHLASTISYVFDALNRVQSQTGIAH